MNLEEFLQEDKNIIQTESEYFEPEAAEQEENDVEVELDVQKAVVESLAADKAEQDEQISRLKQENSELKNQLESLLKANGESAAALENLKEKLKEAESALDETKKELEKAVEALALNADVTVSNTIALLDRNVDLADRFAGETRDHVLEAVKEARDRAEKDGRIRCAQLLEAVMVANESSGELFKKRTALEKFFNENQNILSGTVIAELEKCGISYKKGEEYMLTEEIIRRTY